MTDAVQNSEKPSAVAKRKSARLMAVQAVYQMALNARDPAFVVDEYMVLRKNMEIDGQTLVEPDTALFRDIVLGVSERRGDLAGIVSGCRNLREGQTVADEPLLEAVMLCGVYEILAHHDVDAPLIISAYVDTARAFFEGGEPNLVNAVLDAANKLLRPV